MNKYRNHNWKIANSYNYDIPVELYESIQNREISITDTFVIDGLEYELTLYRSSEDDNKITYRVVRGLCLYKAYVYKLERKMTLVLMIPGG